PPGAVRAGGAGRGVRRAGGREARPRPPRHPQPGQARPPRPVRRGGLAVSILVVDVGTSSVRASIVAGDAGVAHEETRPLLPASPAPGLVEFDPTRMGATALDAARPALAPAGPAPGPAGPVDAVGIADQRCATVGGDRATGEPVGPGLGWQDLRTVGRCIELRGEGLRLAPNESATKLEWLLDQHDPA